MKKRNKDMAKLYQVVVLLMQGSQLPRQYHDHALRGDFVGKKECHIEPDWLLIYQSDDDVLKLIRTGSHSDLFT